MGEERHALSRHEIQCDALRRLERAYLERFGDRATLVTSHKSGSVRCQLSVEGTPTDLLAMISRLTDA